MGARFGLPRTLSKRNPGTPALIRPGETYGKKDGKRIGENANKTVCRPGKKTVDEPGNGKINNINSNNSYCSGKTTGAVAQVELTQKLTRHDVEEAIKEGLCLCGSDLHNIDLSGLNLTGIDLRGANLHGAKLDGSSLHSVHLEGANLQSASLDGANLQYALLQGAKLHGAQMRGAHLEQAHLEGADLQKADLTGASLGSEISTPYVNAFTNLRDVRGLVAWTYSTFASDKNGHCKIKGVGWAYQDQDRNVHYFQDFFAPSATSIAYTLPAATGEAGTESH